MEMVERYDYRDANGRVRHVVNIVERAASVPGRGSRRAGNLWVRAGAPRPGRNTPDAERVARLWGTR